MTDRSLALTKLFAAFPSTEPAPATLAVYVESLADVPPDALVRACEKLQRTAAWFPRISEIRLAVAEEALGLPSELAAREALASAEGFLALHPLVARARKMIGDNHDWKTSDRHAFMLRDAIEAYKGLREEILTEAAAGDLGAIAGLDSDGFLLRAPDGPVAALPPGVDPSELDELRAS